MLHPHLVYVQYPALEPSDAQSEVCKALQLEGNRNTEKDDVKCWPDKIWDAKRIEYIHNRQGKDSHMSTHTVSRVRSSTPTCPE